MKAMGKCYSEKKEMRCEMMDGVMRGDDAK